MLNQISIMGRLTRDAQREGYTEAIYICNAMYAVGV